ncbi:ABC transporter substrate-binding protein [Caldalkalibacillus mannanilyticus]|uniref:ABC transporter substrate-binding protein n=1 Tax=Caldalkalibacillus mannanilyticus TaxID=1418 RepID=UPI000467F0FF|nr:iron-siderophore ABC transporter substrate-binding protein [Caldalkalibacillus mannanilyticus]
MKKNVWILFIFLMMVLVACGQRPVGNDLQESTKIETQMEENSPSEEEEVSLDTTTEETLVITGPETPETDIDPKEEEKETNAEAGDKTEGVQAKEKAAKEGNASKPTNSTNSTKTTKNSSQPKNVTTPQPEKSANQPTTKTVKHAMGNLEVPTNPTRIISLSAQYTDHLLSLGIVPVGTINGASGKEVGWLDRRLSGTTYIGHFQSPDIEMILSLKPDLILGVEKHNSKAYAALSKIAPTVLLQDMEADWRGIYKYVAHVVSKEDVANAKLKEFDQRVNRAKAALAGKIKNETVLFMRVHHKESRLFGTKSHVGKIAYNGLGLKAPSITPTNEVELPISLEKISEFEADHIFLFDTAKKENQDVIKEMQQNPFWKNSKAVQNGNVYLLGDLNDSKAGKGLVLYNLILDGVLDGLLK